MTKLHTLLSESAKARRYRRTVLNLQITFLAWVIEFVGFFVIFLGTFILGHENNIVNYSLQTLTIFIYFIALPSTFLINNTKFKIFIAESNWYSTFLNIFNCQYHDHLEENDNANAVLNSVKEESGIQNNYTT